MFSLLSLLFINSARAEFKYSFESYFYGQSREVSDTSLNPSNQILKIPKNEFDADLRADLRWKTDDASLVFRPRYIYEDQRINGDTKTDSKGDITDLFYEKNWSQNFASTVGLQVYQWGPAEFFNATNPLYHFNLSQKNLYYKEKGQVLLRGNYSFDRDSNVVAIIEPISNNEPEWIAEDHFTPKAILKYEEIRAGTSNLFGLVAGQEEKNNKFLGEYFNWQMTESTSFYTDIKVAQNQINFSPVKSGTFTNLVDASSSDRHWLTFGILGLRWEGDFDVRAEFIYNQAGFNKIDLKALNAAISPSLNPNYLTNLSRFQKIGLELLGQNYAYFSYRVNEPYAIKEFNLYLRYILSGQDNSGQGQIEADKVYFEDYTFFANYSVSSGERDSEFRKINDWQLLAGVKWGI
ncbi:MAG: hypothetical protein ACXVAX_00470 [Pseudobdellovibrio sp.]